MSTLTEQELQSLWNMGNECEAAADEVERLRARVTELESQLSEYEGGDAYTGVIVEIDGHNYGLRHGAARIVKEAMRDAGRYRWLRENASYTGIGDGWHVLREVGDGEERMTSTLNHEWLDAAIDEAMAKGGA